MLEADIAKSLNNNNYDIIDGKVYIKSLNRYRHDTRAIGVELIYVSSSNILESFDSMYKCAKYLDKSYAYIHIKVKSGDKWEFKGKLVFLRKVGLK